MASVSSWLLYSKGFGRCILRPSFINYYEIFQMKNSHYSIICYSDLHAHLDRSTHNASFIIYIEIFEIRNFHYYVICYSDEHPPPPSQLLYSQRSGRPIFQPSFFLYVRVFEIWDFHCYILSYSDEHSHLVCYTSSSLGCYTLR